MPLMKELLQGYTGQIIGRKRAKIADLVVALDTDICALHRATCYRVAKFVVDVKALLDDGPNSAHTDHTDPIANCIERPDDQAEGDANEDGCVQPNVEDSHGTPATQNTIPLQPSQGIQEDKERELPLEEPIISSAEFNPLCTQAGAHEPLECTQSLATLASTRSAQAPPSGSAPALTAPKFGPATAPEPLPAQHFAKSTAPASHSVVSHPEATSSADTTHPHVTGYTPVGSGCFEFSFDNGQFDDFNPTPQIGLLLSNWSVA